MGFAQRLGVDATDEDVLEHFERDSYDGHTYRHLTDARHGIEPGTVLLGDRIVRGFPKVPRILVLDPGVPRQFDDVVHVEEKLNGYNLRVVRHAGDLLAFTRGGYCCPFSTDWVRAELATDEFFDAHPDAVLFGELYGPENPYTSHDYPGVDSLAFAVFDVRDPGSGTPLPVEDRRERCDAYDLPQAPHLGTYDPTDTGAIRERVRELASAGREGIVMKSADGRTLCKYTTGSANRDDLAYAFSVPFDYGRDFVFRRVIREGFQAVEFEEDEDELDARARKLGEAILRPMVETIRAIEDGETIGESHTIRGPPERIDAFLAYLGNQGIRVRIDDDRPENGERVVAFTKVMEATNDRTENYLGGQIVTE